MTTNAWKGLRKHAETAKSSQISSLDAILAAREAIGKYGVQVPQEMAFVRKSTLDNLVHSGSTVARIGLGMWNVEEEGKAPWLARVVSDEEWKQYFDLEANEETHHS